MQQAGDEPDERPSHLTNARIGSFRSLRR